MWSFFSLFFFFFFFVRMIILIMYGGFGQQILVLGNGKRTIPRARVCVCVWWIIFKFKSICAQQNNIIRLDAKVTGPIPRNNVYPLADYEFINSWRSRCHRRIQNHAFLRNSTLNYWKQLEYRLIAFAFSFYKLHAELRDLQPRAYFSWE